MMNTNSIVNHINKEQFKALVNDILDDNVKKTGWFKIGKYKLRVVDTTITNADRVRKFYRNNPKKYKKFLEKRRKKM